MLAVIDMKALLERTMLSALHSSNNKVVRRAVFLCKAPHVLWQITQPGNRQRAKHKACHGPESAGQVRQP
jgi:hypothetical protein